MEIFLMGNNFYVQLWNRLEEAVWTSSKFNTESEIERRPSAKEQNVSGDFCDS